MLITPKQVKAARVLLDWNVENLANRANVTVYQVQEFEKGRARSADVIESIDLSMTAAGIRFLKDGVQLDPDVVTTIEGEGWWLRVLDDVYQTLMDKQDAEILFFYADDRVSPPEVNGRIRKMRNAGIRMRQLVEEGNTYLMGPLKEYRYVPKERFKNYVSAVYGDKVAICAQDNTKALIFHDPNLAWVWRNTFDLIWDHLKQPERSDATERF